MVTNAERTRRGRRPEPVVLLGLSCLVIGACGPGRPPDDGREIAAGFLEEIRAGRVEEAWTATSAEFKSFMGLDRFQAFVDAHPELGEPAEFAGSRMTTINGLKMAESDFRAPEKGSTITVLLAPERGEWKVERLEVE